jgi:D-alanine-D-alanine ligase
VPGEIVPSREFYDYEAKYLDDASQTIIPANLDPATVARIQHLSLEAFRAIDGAGMSRVDFLLSRTTGALALNEINTIPGFTTISMFAKLWEASGVAYAALIDRLIALAIERHAAKQQLRTSAF